MGRVSMTGLREMEMLREISSVPQSIRVLKQWTREKWEFPQEKSTSQREMSPEGEFTCQTTLQVRLKLNFSWVRGCLSYLSLASYLNSTLTVGLQRQTWGLGLLSLCSFVPSHCSHTFPHISLFTQLLYCLVENEWGNLALLGHRLWPPSWVTSVLKVLSRGRENAILKNEEAFVWALETA